MLTTHTKNKQIKNVISFYLNKAVVIKSIRKKN